MPCPAVRIATRCRQPSPPSMNPPRCRWISSSLRRHRRRSSKPPAARPSPVHFPAMKIVQILPELNAGGVERGTLEIAVVPGARRPRVDRRFQWRPSGGGAGKSRCAPVAMPVHRKSLATLLQVLPLRRFLTAEQPDILHIRSRVPGWVAWLAWRGMDPATRPRLVSTVHGFYSVNAYSAVMTRGERVIAVSESIRTYILENYPKTPRKTSASSRAASSPATTARISNRPPGGSANWRAEHPDLPGNASCCCPAASPA